MSKKPFQSLRRSWVSTLCLLIGLVSYGGLQLTGAEAATPAWAAPNSVTVQNLGTIPSTAARWVFEDNQNCQVSTYRLNGTSQNTTGCYVPTAFGSLDIRNNLMAFAGTMNTTIPLKSYGPRDIYVPWPGTNAVLAATPVSNGGVYVGFYRDIIRSSQNQYNLLGQVTAKYVIEPANFALKNTFGQPLLANFNSLTFSSSGDWLVAEGRDGYFIRVNPATQSVQPFAPAFASSGGGYDQSQIAISSSGRYIAIANRAAESLRVYDLTNCTSDGGRLCQYHDYWSAVGTAGQALKHPVHLRFLNDELLSFVDVNSNEETSYVLSPKASINSFTDYIALGDSYTSGEGAHAYRADTDSATNSCHNSANSYPNVLTLSLFNPASGHSVACSGAKIQDLVNGGGYFGQNKNGQALRYRSGTEVLTHLRQFNSGYLPQLSFVSYYQPKVITASIGGNDIGFGDLLKLCVAPHISRHMTAANTCYATYEDRFELAQTIEAQLPKVTNLLKQLQVSSPASTIYAVGYPLIAIDTGNCAVNVHLSTTEIALSIEVIKQLNNMIARASQAANVTYVDVEQALAGHRLCETSSDRIAVNGVTAGVDGGLNVTVAGQRVGLNFLGKESFHPNAYGYELIAAAIRQTTQNLTVRVLAPAIKPPATDPDSVLLQAPESGRPIVKKLPGDITPINSITAGSDLLIQLKGSDYGLRPNSPYDVIIRNGAEQVPIGTIISDDDGNFEGTLISLPIIQPGTYEIGLNGEDQLGNEGVVSDIITIIDNPDDYDGDGTPDNDDSCLTVPNSDQDSDSDGVDDACDSLMDIPPSTTEPNEPPTVVGPPSDTDSREDIVAVMPLPGEPPLGSITVAQPTALGSASSSSQSLISLSQLQPATTPLQANGSAAVLQARTIRTLPLDRPINGPPFQDLQRLPWLQLLLIALVIVFAAKATKRAFFNNFDDRRYARP